MITRIELGKKPKRVTQASWRVGSRGGFGAPSCLGKHAKQGLC
ncbi:hypothetical protein [Hugenholtzia roseola]|nr:hypothetical protein [Hugenholtzia roseola]